MRRVNGVESTDEWKFILLRKLKNMHNGNCIMLMYCSINFCRISSTFLVNAAASWRGIRSQESHIVHGQCTVYCTLLLYVQYRPIYCVALSVLITHYGTHGSDDRLTYIFTSE